MLNERIEQQLHQLVIVYAIGQVLTGVCLRHQSQGQRVTHCLPVTVQLVYEPT